MALVKTQNWEGGSNARYDVSQMERLPDGTYTTDGYRFDSEGRPLSAGVPGDGPDQWTPGLPGARGGTGPGDMGGGGGGGGSPLDPYFQQMRSLLQSQATGDLASTQAAIRKALISFGLDPTQMSQHGVKFEDKLGAVDDVTRSLIAKNTESGISYLARLNEQKKNNLRALVGRLSATGLRRSGAKGKGLRKGQLDFDRIFQDSLSELLGQVGGAYTGYANNEMQRQMQMLQAMQNSQWNYRAPGTSAPGFAAPPPSSTPVVSAGINTGGYVPGSGQITDFANQPRTSVWTGWSPQ